MTIGKQVTKHLFKQGYSKKLYSSDADTTLKTFKFEFRLLHWITSNWKQIQEYSTDSKKSYRRFNWISGRYFKQLIVTELTSMIKQKTRNQVWYLNIYFDILTGKESIVGLGVSTICTFVLRVYVIKTLHTCVFAWKNFSTVFLMCFSLDSCLLFF